MNSPIKWVGGKRKEIKYFEKYIPEFNTYVEPFVGGGALYWHLEPKQAVINDINTHLINFYQVLRDYPLQLSNGVKSYTNTKEEFDSVVKVLNDKEHKNNIELAEIFYYINKTCFSGKWRVNKKGKFNSSYGYYKADNYKKLPVEASDLLKRTEIHNQDYKDIMEKYKNDNSAFIFLDPPYLECDTFYTETQKFENIYEYISNYTQETKAKLMLIVKENEYIRNMFSKYIIDEYDINYRHNAVSKKLHKHLIITNY